MIDLILIEESMKNRLIDVTVRRGVAGGISDHFLVECKVKRCARKKYVNRGECAREIVKVSEFEKKEVRDAFRMLIEVEWLRVKDTRLLGVTDEWEKFKSLTLKSAGEVCGYKRIGRKGKKSEWWDDEMRELIEDKRRLYELYLRTKCEHDKNEYNMKKREVKYKVREKKRMVDERWGESLSKNFREKKKLFWKEVNTDRKNNDQMEMRIRNADGHLLTVGEDVIGRFRGYFEELLNVDDGREAQLSGERIPGVNQSARYMLEVSVGEV